MVTIIRFAPPFDPSGVALVNETYTPVTLESDASLTAVNYTTIEAITVVAPTYGDIAPLLKKLRDDAQKAAQKSEDWAITPEDTLVPDETDYSSKHYAAKSSGSATESETSATNAKDSETNAATSEANAKTSETNAATSEANAKVSETNAATSETNAKASESKAMEWAVNPEDSEVEAGQFSSLHHAAKAAASAAQSASSATNAKQSETNAAQSATSAGQSASDASGSATKAEQWATYPKSNLVPGETDYSSKHYAETSKDEADRAKSYADSLQNALVYEGTWNPNSGAYPAPPAPGITGTPFYIVSEDGNFDGINWSVGDQIIWNATSSSWDRIAGAAVYSVNGKRGDVIIVSGDIAYSNTGTQLAATDVQAAITELDTRAESSISHNVSADFTIPTTSLQTYTNTVINLTGGGFTVTIPDYPAPFKAAIEVIPTGALTSPVNIVAAGNASITTGNLTLPASRCGYVRLVLVGTASTSKTWTPSSGRFQGSICHANYAAATDFDPSGNALASTNVQDAIEEVLSGVVDADTVDGLQADQFVRSDSSDTMNGNLTVTGVVTSNTRFQSTNSDGYRGADKNGVQRLLIRYGTDNNVYIGGVAGNPYFSNGSNSYAIWHAGNDGSGSGLDADRLDGLQGSQFARADTDDVISGQYRFDSYHPINANKADIFHDGNAPDIATPHVLRSFRNHAGATWGWERFANGDLTYSTGTTASGSSKISLHFNSGTISTSGQGTLWGSNNDGAGSGLDADTLDGLQSTRFARISSTSANANNFLHLSRNSSGGAPLYVNQTGSGDIARFFKGSNTDATTGSTGLTIASNGNLQAATSQGLQLSSIGTSSARGVWFTNTSHSPQASIGCHWNPTSGAIVGYYFGSSKATQPWSNWLAYVHGNGDFTAARDIRALGTRYYGDNKAIIEYSDNWLRLNPLSNFSSGIYCGNQKLRNDGDLQIGSGSQFTVTSSGNVTASGTITAAGAITTSKLALATDAPIHFDGGSSKWMRESRGNYGTISVGDGNGGWGGYSIRDQYLLMANNSSGQIGLYNDIENEWFCRGQRNAEFRLFYNGSTKLATKSDGVTVTGELYATTQVEAPTVRVSNDTDTYISSAGVFDDGKRCYSENNPPPTPTPTRTRLFSGYGTTSITLSESWKNFRQLVVVGGYGGNSSNPDWTQTHIVDAEALKGYLANHNVDWMLWTGGGAEYWRVRNTSSNTVLTNRNRRGEIREIWGVN